MGSEEVRCLVEVQAVQESEGCGAWWKCKQCMRVSSEVPVPEQGESAREA